MSWLDAHLSPRIARFNETELGHPARPIRDLSLRDAEDNEIFEEARKQNAVLITKDSDSVDLMNRLGPPPHVIWLTCGNTSERRLKEIFADYLPSALALIENGEPLIEISG